MYVQHRWHQLQRLYLSLDEAGSWFSIKGRVMSIVKFKSKAYTDIIMFKEHASRLFSIMGIETSERGVITPDQLTAAHAHLVAAINMEKMVRSDAPLVDEDDLSAEERLALKNHVSLEQRAYPLLKMLEAATQKNVDVHWGF
jgi:hypothetical protein